MFINRLSVCMYVLKHATFKQMMPAPGSKLQRNEVSVFMVGLHYKIGQHLNEFGTPQAINRLSVL